MPVCVYSLRVDGHLRTLGISVNPALQQHAYKHRHPGRDIELRTIVVVHDRDEAYRIASQYIKVLEARGEPIEHVQRRIWSGEKRVKRVPKPRGVNAFIPQLSLEEKREVRAARFARNQGSKKLLEIGK